MGNLPLWCWEAAQLKSGPDWFFIAQVIPACASALTALVVQSTPAGFSPCFTANEYCTYHEQVCSYDTFIDTSNLETYTNNLTDQAAQNIWVYNLIRTHRDMLEFISGYGGRGEITSCAETALLHALLDAPQITLHRWEVYAGGDGYAYRTLRNGTDTASLRAYLL
ncbi:MAG: hypothetical protein HGA19_00775 [Oscillochloris sp.]|nr:hypothetical protein [Oscillochloris sp.]